MKSRFASEYRINKKGCEIFRTTNFAEALGRFHELSEKRPGVFSLQTRTCQLDRYGVKLKDGTGKPIWSTWG